LDLNRFFQDVGTAYERRVIDADKQPQVFILVSFLITFTIVRVITHAIRAGRWRHVLRNVQSGGTHIHHLVPGILLLLTSGYLGIGLSPHQPREWVAVIFGVGAALTLDEFALWLHLEDVYWAKEGRQSIDAIVIAIMIGGLVVLGGSFWTDLGRAIDRLVTG
jgi:hypothetical protein